MSLIERRVGSPTTIYGAGTTNQLALNGVSSGHTGHNYEYVQEYVFDLSDEMQDAADMLENPSVVFIPEGAAVLEVELLPMGEESEDVTAVTVNAVDAESNAVELLAGTDLAVGTITVERVNVSIPADSVVQVTSASDEGYVMVRVKFKRAII